MNSMNLLNRKFLILLSISILAFSCGNLESQKNLTTQNQIVLKNENNQFYSKAGKEVVVEFDAEYETTTSDLSFFNNLSKYQKENFEKYEIPETLQFLFGPLTYRSQGGTQKVLNVQIDWNSLYLNRTTNKVRFNYHYKGLWIVSQNLKTQLDLPLPYNNEVVFTKNWKSCTDSDPEHQTESFYWYFWEPSRWGCDHKLGVQYQNVTAKFGDETLNQKQTFPEYDKLLQANNQDKNLQMTFAFGYVSDVENPNPFKDSDYGMSEFRKFHNYVQTLSTNLKLKELPILKSKYLNESNPKSRIGTEFIGEKNGVRISIKVVASAGVDQMKLFAESYAHDHDSFFGWFGHSRVGSGFDADNFRYMVNSDPQYYSITQQYQIIYWAGCNSYSYYTLPFFKMKSKLNPDLDVNGTKNLDIISNGLPSLFSFNAYNAKAALEALVNFDKKTSYQDLVSNIENYARRSGETVLVNVLGDEDNQL